MHNDSFGLSTFREPSHLSDFPNLRFPEFGMHLRGRHRFFSTALALCSLRRILLFPALDIFSAQCAVLAAQFSSCQTRKEKHLLFGVRLGAFSVVHPSGKQPFSFYISLSTRRAKKKTMVVKTKRIKCGATKKERYIRFDHPHHFSRRALHL